MLLCKFCFKEHISSNSLKNHESRCKSNPDRKVTSVGNRKGIQSWNAGLTDDPRLKHSNETKVKLSEIAKSRTSEWHQENGKRISAAIQKKVAEGEWHTSLAKKMHINYKGVDLHGTWELKYAMYLDSKSVNWIRCKERFAYEFDNKERWYTPDFYLLDSDEYVEIKGYKTEKDVAKWEQFPKHRKLKVFMHQDLIELGIDV